MVTSTDSTSSLFSSSDQSPGPSSGRNRPNRRRRSPVHARPNSPQLDFIDFIEKHKECHSDVSNVPALAFDAILSQMRTKCEPKKPRNIVQALAYRQIDPNPWNVPYNKAQNHLHSSLSSTFANRIQEFRNFFTTDPPFLNEEPSFERTFMYQPVGLSSDSVVLMKPHKEIYLSLKPKVTTSANSNEPLSADLDFEHLTFGPLEERGRSKDKEDQLIFVHENAFNDIKFKNAEESPNNNVPMFFVHIPFAIYRTYKSEFCLHSILFCQYETTNGQVRNGKLHFRDLRTSFHDFEEELKYEPYLGPNRPFEHYYIEPVAKPDIIFEHDMMEHDIAYHLPIVNEEDEEEDEPCECDECVLVRSGTAIGPKMPIEESLPLNSYCAMHWDLIRTFYCKNTITCSGLEMHPHLQSLQSFDIRYREPGYHPYPIPCAALCGYSNGHLRLCAYDRRFPPMRREIKLHNRAIQQVKFHPKNDLQFFVSGDRNFLRLYDMRMFPFGDSALRPGKGQDSAPAPVLDYHEHRSTHYHHQITLDPTTNLLVSSGSDNMIRFWNSSTGKLERCFDPRHVVHPYKEYPIQAFYSGDFRYERKLDGPRDSDSGIRFRSEVLFTKHSEVYRMFTSKIYNSAY